MSQSLSAMSRAKRSLVSVQQANKYLASFYNRAEGARGQGSSGLAWCMAGVPPELLGTFDLEMEFPENFGAHCASTLVATSFIEVAESEGYSSDLCSYLTNSMGYVKRYKELGRVPPESPLKQGLGEPTLMMGSGYMCDPRLKWFQAMNTRYFDVPMFNSDPMSPPYDVDVDDPRIAHHYIAQLRQDLHAQVAFLEKHTGKKLDGDKFLRRMKNSQKALAIWHEITALRKARPCPIAAEDYFTAIIPQLYMLGAEEPVNFYEAILEETKMRVEKGIGVIPEEKYRLIWAGGIPPWFNLGFFNYLGTLGAVVVVGEAGYYAGQPVDIDLNPADPLEALVQRAWRKACALHRSKTVVAPESCNPAVFGLPGSDLLMEWIRDYHVDGALMHRTRSCRAASVGQLHIKNLLQDAGISTLIFESDMADPRQWSDERIKTQVEAFLESLDARAPA